ncbi:MAG: hypothetical protein HYY24_21985 [Verrucomicrobia bacterium]|nr:hypothetical protein [Verrucomicrobiota bacterium]
MLWRSVNETAKRQAEDGSPAAAMEWLATLPFASASDYARVVGDVFRVWILKSETDATARLQNARLDPALKAGLLAPAKP